MIFVLFLGMDHDLQMKYLLLTKEYMDDEDSFWDLICSATNYICMHYLTYIHKVPRMTSSLTGKEWMNELLNGHEIRCFNSLRMYPNLFIELCTDLETKYGLKSSSHMLVTEKVGMFVYILAHGVSNRHAQERFQHSGETVSRVFKEVLHAMDGLSRDIIVPTDPEFKEVPQKLATDSRYMPYFKVIHWPFTFFIIQ